eukprot:CAMPEP_0183357134 /NCGR_PEP_ID=MMETSP0164_2-20130417/45429_1 /TAXON_ID=221442 /ORGANISM="Coccolithus pelagicus ssp braarudi, Strain PLY182g" /LENGTH=62 /DNA_ID=CAMNT_0025530689 /DNA_START=755 /DNA_END=940 /DNA_ORIENTATION=+
MKHTAPTKREVPSATLALNPSVSKEHLSLARDLRSRGKASMGAASGMRKEKPEVAMRLPAQS